MTEGGGKRLADEVRERIIGCVSEQRLVDTACELVAIPSPTGDEQAMAEKMRELLGEAGLRVMWQEVEEGRPNVIGLRPGVGDGRSLMFNGHLDTSYSGAEAETAGRTGFAPSPVVRDGRIWGLGISNMKGALACYLEAARALRDSGVTLAGELMVAAVVGEIEKAQWGEFRGAAYRGYAAGSRYAASHGAVADMCVLGEPTEHKIVLGHFGTMWVRISTSGPFVHTAFADGDEQNAIVRMTVLLERVRAWARDWAAETSYESLAGAVNIAAIRAGHPWRASRTPQRCDLFLDVRVPPTMRMQDARRAFQAFVRELVDEQPDSGIESEIFVTAPGAEIASDHELVQAIDASHSEVFGQPPERDRVRWFSDASALTRYGIECVNYGASSGLPDADGENLEIEGLLDVARVYALVAARVCEATP